MKKTISLFFILIFLLTAAACTSGQRTARQAFAFDTVINITTDEKDSFSINQAFEKCRSYEKIFSRTDSESELYAINQGSVTQLSADMQTVMKFSLEFSRLTDGAFDVTVAPLVELWNINGRTVPPSEKEIKEALSPVGYEKIQFEPFSAGGAAIDLGAVAKGYIADRLTEYFSQSGITNVIVDLGGNVAVLGEYTVGIRNPFNPGQVFATIKLKDKSAVTSGAYQRYFEYQGKRYHHIIDPRTGKCAESGIASVTVISPSSMHADALSTAIYVSGTDALTLCSNFPDTDALIITVDGEVITTENFEKKYDLRIE